MRCTAIKQDGTPCGNKAMLGHEVCQPHSEGLVGQRSKLTDDDQQEICEAGGAGSYLGPAARRAGVSEKTVYEWLRRGEAPDAPSRLAAFVAAFERAEADAEMHCLAVIRRETSRGDGRLALELLSRRHPERWAKNRRGSSEESEAADESPLDLSRLSDAEYEQLKELQRRASGD